MDYDHKDNERALSERTKAIVVTHLFGNPSEPKLVAIADCAWTQLREVKRRFYAS